MLNLVLAIVLSAQVPHGSDSIVNQSLMHNLKPTNALWRELAHVRELRHTELVVLPVKPFPPRIDFSFFDDPKKVLSNLPLPKESSQEFKKGHFFRFRCGTRFALWVNPPNERDEDGVTCRLYVYVDIRH